MEPNGILIYGQLNKDYTISPVVKQLLSKACELKEKLWNQEIKVCVVGPRIDYEKIITELGNYGADKVIIVSDSKLTEYNQNYYPETFFQIAKKYPSRIILIGATQEGKEIASYTSTKLETGLTADCTDLDIGQDGHMISTRPTFGGCLIADITCKTFPQMATVQENIFKELWKENKSQAIFEWIYTDNINQTIELLKKSEKKLSGIDISTSKVIISGGAGACCNNGFALLYELAQVLNGTVAGSREAYEKGFITKSQQIGQTGKTVSPKVYIAIGISGANQHLTGIKNSDKIIAINKDENAPIFKHADIGIVGDLFEIIPKLIEEIRR